jgi:pSer/pThr/pTyr-binding forkhead associated (FHA) protein
VKLILAVISGFDQGKRQSFTDFPISIGRLPDNDFQLNDPFVSRRHCTIYKEENYFSLSDLKSTNKTVLNGEILNAPVKVKKADQLGLGSNLIEIDLRL